MKPSLAAAGVLFTFMLAVRLRRPLAGLPAFVSVLLLMCSPIFYTQSMMAQLDMPAMVFTSLSLFLFLEERYALAALACTVLVLTKETALTTPAILGAWLLWERRWREAVDSARAGRALCRGAGLEATLGALAMFANGAGCVYQIQYLRDRRAVPITRDYIAAAEARYRASEAPAAARPRRVRETAPA